MNQLQKEILKVYKEVKRVCDKNKIRYYAVAGTALGAVRHHGFIPWDDDMDLGIPIEDFEKFKKACKKDLKEPFEFVELNWMGGKVHNKNTTFIEAPCLLDNKKHYGVYVDIFPLVGVPNDEERRKAFLLEVRKYFIKAFTFDRYPEASKMSESELLKWKKKLCGANDYEVAERVLEFAIAHRFTMRRAGLEKSVLVDFEDTTVPVSGAVKEDLTERYGDFMKLPPKSQRVAHAAAAIIDFKTPCAEYAKKIEKIDPEILNLLRIEHGLEGEFFDTAHTMSVEYEILEKEYKRACRELTLLKNKERRSLSSCARRLVRKVRHD